MIPNVHNAINVHIDLDCAAIVITSMKHTPHNNISKCADYFKIELFDE